MQQQLNKLFNPHKIRQNMKNILI